MKNYLYATYLPSDEDVIYIIGLYYSYRKIESSYPFIVLYANNISQASLNRLENYGINLLKIPDEYQYFNDFGNDQNTNYVFNMTNYDKIIFIGKNNIFTQNMDAVFESTNFPFFWHWPNKDNKQKIKLLCFSCIPDTNMFNNIISYCNQSNITNEEILYTALTENEYNKTFLKYPAFFKYLYVMTDEYLSNNISNNDIENKIDIILADTWKLSDFKYKYFRYVVGVTENDGTYINPIIQHDYE